MCWVLESQQNSRFDYGPKYITPMYFHKFMLALHTPDVGTQVRMYEFWLISFFKVPRVSSEEELL